MLAQPELEQLAQRVIARFHLQALSEAETTQYIRHRLAVAGMKRSIPFDKPALQRIHAIARGVPRRINLLCDRALLGAYSQGKAKVDRRIVDTAAQEVFDTGPTSAAAGAQRKRVTAWALAFGGAVLLCGAAIFALVGGPQRPGTVAAAASAVPLKHPASAPSAALAAASAAAISASAAASVPQPFDPKADFKALLRSEKDAWRALAPAWKLTLADGDPCTAAQRQQLHCFRGNGNLALLRQLDRPAVLTLHDGAGRAGYAVLGALANDGATLRFDGGDHLVALSALDDAWRGEFATFWRAPAGYVDSIADVAAGPPAQWVAEQLGKLQPAGAASAPLLPLKGQIQAFQVAQGLKPDGLAGPVTLMQLNRLAGVDEPRLQR